HPDHRDQQRHDGEAAEDQGVDLVGREDLGAHVLERGRLLDRLVWGDLLDGPDDGWDQRKRTARGADEEAPAPAFLIHRLVNGHLRIGNDVGIVEIGHHAHDAAGAVADADELHHRVGPMHGAVEGGLAGERRSATLLLMMTTGSAPDLSLSRKSRPASSGTPRVEKYAGDTERKLARRSSTPFLRGAPSTANSKLMVVVCVSRQGTMKPEATLSTPGSWATRRTTWCENSCCCSGVRP